VALYLKPPLKTLVFCIYENPNIQALQRKAGYILTQDDKSLRAYRGTYNRNGTLNLFAVLKVATGTVIASATERKTREDFLEFMDRLVEEYPEQELYFILNKYCTHKQNEKWLAAHPLAHFHFTPTSAIWLNIVEICFGIFTRKSLTGASYTCKEELREQIEAQSTKTLNL
jgi:hypothetical protein